MLWVFSDSALLTVPRHLICVIQTFTSNPVSLQREWRVQASLLSQSSENKTQGSIARE